jgi:16S rRNA (guanine(1405)-N(7))-methyltransferase
MSHDPVALLAAIRASAKYAQVSDALILRIGAQELARRKTLKDAIEATRNKLHQVAGLYQEPKMRYARWLDELDAAADDPEALKRACLSIMRHHASTRERAPLLNDFYPRLFAGLPPIRSVLDIACGLNPLCAPCMPLAPGAVYHALDVYDDLRDFLNRAGSRLRIDIQAQTRDVLSDAPFPETDVALLLKTLPCLEQVDKDAGARLLDRMRARFIVISYPTRSVGGKNVGMAAHYSERFAALTSGRGWRVERVAFENELAYLVRVET